MNDLRRLVRTIPDYPKPGILFRDVTTLFGDAQGFKAAIEGMAAPGCRLRVNDHEVPVNQDGKFSASALLQDGENKIRFIMTEKNGKVTAMDRIVVRLKSMNVKGGEGE